MRKYDPCAQRMAFSHQVGPPGSQETTVRLGRKWLDLHENGVRDVVMIDANGRPFGAAVITAVAYLRIEDVPAEFYWDGVCTPEQLAEAVGLVYHRPVKTSDYVTIVFFYRKD